MKYVYVAGPYSAGDPVLNTRKAIEVGESLIECGFMPFIPHITLLWHLIYPHEIDYWYDYDNEWLKKCDALLRLPGKSPGADAEVKLAAELGIPIYLSITDLCQDQECRCREDHVFVCPICSSLLKEYELG